MPTYMHTYIHIHTHRHTHTHLLTGIRTFNCRHVSVHTSIHTTSYNRTCINTPTHFPSYIQDTCHLQVVSQGVHKTDQREDLHRPRAPDLPSGMAFKSCVFSASASRLRPPLVHAANAHAHQLGDYECHDRLTEHHGHVTICEELLACRTFLLLSSASKSL